MPHQLASKEQLTSSLVMFVHRATGSGTTIHSGDSASSNFINVDFPVAVEN